jgi:hypothetical protein
MYLTAFPDPSFDSHALGVAMRPWSELLPEHLAADTANSLCLAHMDAYLKNDGDALAFLDQDLSGTFARRGVEIEVASDLNGSEPGLTGAIELTESLR